MPTINGKFICCKFIEFTDVDGKIVRGYLPYVLTENDNIIKCKLRKSALNDLSMGDDVIVNVLISGKFVKYELAV